MKIRKYIFLILVWGLLLSDSALSCTTAIISGKATPDGRPILWKHRDSNHYQNKLMFFEGNKYHYIGLVNAEDINGEEIWAGTNAAGFCIMNAASYNLKGSDDTTKVMDKEGFFMKEALEKSEM